MSEPDVCIIGGGPAGLAAAISLRLTGASVILFEANRPPIDKACGEGLMPNTIAALGELGVRLDKADGYALRGIRFWNGAVSATAKFRTGAGLGVRRTHLHAALVKRAETLGVTLYWDAKSVGVLGRSLAIGDNRLEPALLVGADGLNSCLRRTHDFPADAGHARYGFRKHFRVRPWSDHVEIYCGAHRQIYVTPVSTEEIGVALLTDDPHDRLEEALSSFPALHEYLRHAPASSRERGSVTVTRRLKRVTKSGLALIGDASGSVDAITGEGIGLAIEQAIALGEAFGAGDFERYQRAHRRIGRRAHLLAHTLLACSESALVQKAAIQIASRLPFLLDIALTAYVRRRPSISGTAGRASGNISLPNPKRLNSQS